MLKNISLSLLSVFLLSAAYLNTHLAWLSLLAFAPLLLAEKNLNHPSKNIENAQWLLLSSLFSFGWFGLSSYWQGSFSGLSWFSYSAGLTLALMLFKFCKDTLGHQRGYISLAFFWLSAEAIHFYLNLGAQPITLGYAFKNNPLVGHWLHYIGYFGVGLWVLISGLILYFISSDFLSKRQWKLLLIQGSLAIGLLVVAPLLFGSSPDGYPPSETTAAEVNKSDSREQTTPSSAEKPKKINANQSASLAPADKFIARLSFFIAGFQVLFSLVKAFLDKRKIV